MIIGICGLIGAGKDTIANRLVQHHGYERYSWATPLKDMTASLFGWDRDMLEGNTPEARQQREQVDAWWDEKLGKVDLWSPRYALQFIGTEVMRDTLHQDIWVLAGMKRMAGKSNVVIPDTRFPNEIKAIREMGGKIWMVKRGPMPEWYDDLLAWNQRNKNVAGAHAPLYMAQKWPHVHASEYSWNGTSFDAVIPNDGSISALEHTVDVLLGGVTGIAH